MIDLSTVLLELAPILVRKGKKWLSESPLELAITATDSLFPDVECRPALTAWASSQEFDKLMRDLLAGQAPDLESLVLDFQRVGNFAAGDESETHRRAREVLDVFAPQLWNQLLLSEQGRVVATGAIISRLDVLGRGMDALLAAGPPGDASTEIQVRIDTARSLIHAGRTSAARQLLVELREERFGPLDAEASFRVFNNLGACALRDGKVEEAESEFHQALGDMPGHPKAIANLALVEVLRGNHTGALASLEQLKPEELRDAHVASIRILALGRSHDWVGLDRLLQSDDWLRSDDTCLTALGEVYCEGGRYEEAIEALHHASAANPDNAEAWLLLALATYELAHIQLRDRFAAGLVLPADSRSALEEALEFIEKSLAILEEQDPSPRLVDCRAGRAGLLAMLGKDEEALQACDAALADDPDHAIALRNKGLLLVDRSLEESAQVLRKAVSVDPTPLVSSALARILVEANSSGEAIGVLEPFISQDLPLDEAILVARELVHALVVDGQKERAREVIDWLEAKPSGMEEALLLRASLLTSSAEIDERTSLLRRATLASSGRTRIRAIVDLGDTLFEHGEFAEAADLYGSLGLDSMDESLSRRYVASLFNGRRYGEALETARAIRAGGPAVLVVTEIELLILEQEDSVEAALDLALEISDLEPDNPAHRVRAADLAIRLHREEEAVAIAAGIPEASYWSESRDCINVAILRARLSMDGVTRIAYRAHRLSPGDSEVESRFIGLVINRDPDIEGDLGDPEEVRVGTSVTLELSDGERVVTIEEDDPGLLDHEVPPSDALAVALLGRRVGEVVTLKDTPLERIDATVKAIRLSWIAGFQMAIEGFTTRFPDHPGMSRISIQDDDLTPFFLAVEGRHRLVSQVLQLYQERRIPLGRLAFLSGASEIEVWGGIVSSRNTKMFAADGSSKEQARQGEILADSKGLILEVTSLLTIGSLEMEGSLKEAFPKLVIAQSSLDLLTRAIESNFLGARPSMVLGMDEGRFIRSDVTEEDLSRGKAFFERMRDFATQSTEVASTEAGLALDPTDREQLNALLGQAGVASALLASERHVAIFSDDLFFRTFAEGRWGVDGAWTQAVLRELVGRGSIDKSAYEDALVKLAASGYRFISLSSADLVGLLQRELAFTPGFGRLLELLRGPDCSLDSAVSMVADLIRSLYLEGFMPVQRSLVLDAALAALTHGRDPGVALAMLGRALDSRLLLLPLALDDVRSHVLVWARQLGLNV